MCKDLDLTEMCASGRILDDNFYMDMKIFRNVLALVMAVFSCWLSGCNSGHAPGEILCYNVLENSESDYPVFCFYYDSAFHFRNSESAFAIDDDGRLVDPRGFGDVGFVLPLSVPPLMVGGVDTLHFGVVSPTGQMPSFEATVVGMESCHVCLERGGNDEVPGYYEFALSKSEQRLLQHVLNAVKNVKVLDRGGEAHWGREIARAQLDGWFVFFKMVGEGLSGESFVNLAREDVPPACFLLADAMGAIVNNHIDGETFVSGQFVDTVSRTLFLERLRSGDHDEVR